MMLSSSMEELERLSAEISLGILRWLKAMLIAKVQFLTCFDGSSLDASEAMPGFTTLMRAISALYVCVSW